MIASAHLLRLLALACCSLAVRPGDELSTIGDELLAPDLVIVHANVHTLDAGRPTVEAIAITKSRIVAVGSSAEIQRLAGPSTRTIDAGGKLVLPGFDDAHVHFLEGGFQLANVDLRDAATPQEFAERIRRFAEKLPRGGWVTGGDWDHERWPIAALPTKELVDAFTPDTPVFVDRLDGHMGLANSCALKLAGITRDTKDPDGGLIVRDAKTGEPTGILKDAAKSLMSRVIPEPSFDAKLAAGRAASEHAARFGVTSVQDMSAGDDVGVYQELLRRGQLETRIYALTSLTHWDRIASTGVRAPFGSEWIRIGGLKGFSDGSLGSTTALLFDPYVDAPDTHGLPSGEMFPEGAMLERVMRADAAALQIVIHAIGDRANDTILSIFEKVAAEHGARDRRFRIEHAQHLRKPDIARFGADHVIASMQPYHCADDGRWAEKRIGPERAKTTYAFRTLLDTGATLAFGTDWTVAPIDPMLGIKAAVTRETLDGKHPGGWIPEQKITVEEAVRAYTVGSAYAEFQENEKGSITPGKLADLVILSRDIFTIAPKEIDQTRVVTTIVGGRVVYEASGR
jgi:predicted amidohydrolase YtcJ